MDIDDMPLPGKKQQPSEYPEGDEQPVSRGAYNLDNLEELER